MKIIVDIPENILDTIDDGQFISREQLAVLQKHIMDGAAYFENAPTVETEKELKILKVKVETYQTAYRIMSAAFEGEVRKNKRQQDKWGKWEINEIRCPICLEYFNTDCYSMEELNTCPSCGADMMKGGQAHE